MTLHRGIPFVLSAPSGTGKSTLCRALLERDPKLALSVSHTTRAPRPGEVSGRDYHFVSRAEFERLVHAGAFLEHAEYRGHHYGTSLHAVEETLAAGRDLLLEIEVQGARQVRARLPEARLVFVLPPSGEELAQRLVGRGTESAEVVARRLEVAIEQELPEVAHYHWAVVNDRVETAVSDLLAIVLAERAGRTAPLEERFRPARALARVGGLERLIAGARKAFPAPGAALR